MYIQIVKAVLDEVVEFYATDLGLSVGEILAQIRAHIDNTAKEHRQDEPEIEYGDPLCRLGYLYRHATANATLFRRVLRDSDSLKAKVRAAKRKTLSICSVGGGPGTELLGLAKYFLEWPIDLPRKIKFTVLDNVAQWSETWGRLAEAVDAKLQEALEGSDEESPTIADHFIEFDALDKNSYKNFQYQFVKTDIVIFNYLFSENKARLSDAKRAITHLAKIAPAGCVFVVIDRRERGGKFTDDVVDAFYKAGFAKPKVKTLAGFLDTDEQTADMGKLFTETLGLPRVKFFTDVYRDPTVFWFETVKE
jgi:Putative SAM-dependent methyltransferase